MFNITKTVDTDPTPIYGTCQMFYNANHNNVTPDVSYNVTLIRNVGVAKFNIPRKLRFSQGPFTYRNPTVLKISIK